LAKKQINSLYRKVWQLSTVMLNEVMIIVVLSEIRYRLINIIALNDIKTPSQTAENFSYQQFVRIGNKNGAMCDF
jgi:hypothetical protein